MYLAAFSSHYLRTLFDPVMCDGEAAADVATLTIVSEDTSIQVLSSHLSCYTSQPREILKMQHLIMNLSAVNLHTGQCPRQFYIHI